MRIVFSALGFGKGDNLGGSVRVAAQNAKALADLGHDVLFLCTNQIDKKKKLFPKLTKRQIDKVTVIYLDTYTMSFWPGDFGPHFVHIPKWVKEKISGYDIIHLHEYRSSLSVQLIKLGKRFSIPVIMHPQGTFFHHGNRTFIKQVYDLLYGNDIKKIPQYFIACTNSEANDFSRSGIDAGKIKVVPNGIALSDYTVPEKGAFRKKILANDSSPFFLSIGRLDPLKGFDVMIKAMADIPEEWKYVIVGPDQQGYSDELKKITTELKLQDKIVITGALPNREDVQEALHDCDVLVVPSIVEAFGQVILEGCVARKPLILSTGCKIADEFAGDYALVVDPAPAAMSGACNKLINDPLLRETIAQNANQLCKDTYQIEVIAANLENIYIGIIHNPAPTA